MRGNLINESPRVEGFRGGKLSDLEQNFERRELLLFVEDVLQFDFDFVFVAAFGESELLDE